MDGVLLIDKPVGPTSHDVVVRLRQTTGERSIGHTGTLDPQATGLLPLVLGRATRLAPFLMSGLKTYEAAIRLGVSTDTDDAAGRPCGPQAAALPDDAHVDAALETFRGTFEQVPPRHSAKRVRGEKAYALARRDRPVDLKPVLVTVHALERLGREEDRLRLRVTASAGFYVRALARDLGQRLGCGGHLASLRRTRSGIFDVADATPLAAAERLGADIFARLIQPADALRDLPSVQVTDTGFKRVAHGNWLAPEHLASRPGLSRPEASETADSVSSGTRRVRVLTPDGRLIALAEPRGAALHPVVVLG